MDETSVDCSTLIKTDMDVNISKIIGVIKVLRFVLKESLRFSEEDTDACCLTLCASPLTDVCATASQLVGFLLQTDNRAPAGRPVHLTGHGSSHAGPFHCPFVPHLIYFWFPCTWRFIYRLHCPPKPAPVHRRKRRSPLLSLALLTTLRYMICLASGKCITFHWASLSVTFPIRFHALLLKTRQHTRRQNCKHSCCQRGHMGIFEYVASSTGGWLWSHLYLEKWIPAAAEVSLGVCCFHYGSFSGHIVVKACRESMFSLRPWWLPLMFFKDAISFCCQTWEQQEVSLFFSPLPMRWN